MIREEFSAGGPTGVVTISPKLSAAVNELEARNKSAALSSAVALAVAKQAIGAKTEKKAEWDFGIISSAFAQSSSLGVPAQPVPDWTIDALRPTVMITIIGAITVFFLFCIGLYCMTKDTEKLKFADNMMRTIVGFYIGIVTGLLGLPTR
ncbi:hypothetical protein GCM10008965_39230 [Methylorubrum aminovorans]|nr:hypothetical protein GCM10025880_22680 [Methylorubrum aminovorans]